MTYQALARHYDHWTRNFDYRSVLRFSTNYLQRSLSDSSVADLCCGTGTLAFLFAEAGANVTGFDGSQEMLEKANSKASNSALPGEIEFLERDLSKGLDSKKTYDLITCTFDSMNYFDRDQTKELFEDSMRHLKDGGVMIFDINTEFKIRSIFGNSVYAESHDDYSYIWKNRLGVDHIDYYIEMFVKKDEIYTKHFERHRQYIHDIVSMSEDLRGAGFSRIDICDDYKIKSFADDTLRATFVARRAV